MGPRLQQTATFIEVWSAAAASEHSGALEEQCQAWLTDEECLRAARFRKDTSRNQHVVGRGMTRRLLAAPFSGQLDPSEIVFELSPHGKPFVVAPAHAARPFNVAHTDGLVLFAACGPNVPQQNGSLTVGVDVERVCRRTDVALAQRYFAAPEVQYVFDHSDPDVQRTAFLRVWTLKEAFIKAIGTGLTMPLGDFAFEDIDSERPRVRMLNPALGSAENWQFISFWPAAGYIGALAVGDWPESLPCQLQLRRFESLLGLPVVADEDR